MTRETKIGMLVGLAFIIVIGILLSDHMTSTTEPPKADQANAGDALRRGTTTLTTADAQTVRTEIPPPTIPSQPLPTREEMNPRPAAPVAPAVQNIQVGPGGSPTPVQSINIAQGNGSVPTPVVIGPGNVQQPQTPIIITPAPAQPGSQVAVGPQPTGTETLTPEQQLAMWSQKTPVAPTPETHTPQPPAGVPMAAVKSYKAEAGDNLHKMAQKTMGVSTKVTRDAILAANPSLKANPDKIIVGKTYTIPPLPGAAATPAPSPMTPTPAPQPASAAIATGPQPSEPGVFRVESEQELADAMQKVLGGRATPASTPASSVETADANGFRWYTVKENDTLWGIAAEYLGAGSKLNTIKELNKDVLKGGDTVHPNMKLRLPSKQVASAS